MTRWRRHWAAEHKDTYFIPVIADVFRMNPEIEIPVLRFHLALMGSKYYTTCKWLTSQSLANGMSCGRGLYLPAYMHGMHSAADLPIYSPGCMSVARLVSTHSNPSDCNWLAQQIMSSTMSPSCLKAPFPPHGFPFPLNKLPRTFCCVTLPFPYWTGVGNAVKCCCVQGSLHHLGCICHDKTEPQVLESNKLMAI